MRRSSRCCRCARSIGRAAASHRSSAKTWSGCSGCSTRRRRRLNSRRTSSHSGPLPAAAERRGDDAPHARGAAPRLRAQHGKDGRNVARTGQDAAIRLGQSSPYGSPRSALTLEGRPHGNVRAGRRDGISFAHDRVVRRDRVRVGTCGCGVGVRSSVARCRRMVPCRCGGRRIIAPCCVRFGSSRTRICMRRARDAAVRVRALRARVGADRDGGSGPAAGSPSRGASRDRLRRDRCGRGVFARGRRGARSAARVGR